MYKKAEIIQDFAYRSATKNRVIGSVGHQDTVDYIVKQIKKYPDYYTVETQGVPLSLGRNATLTADGKAIEAYAVDLAPAGSVSGDLVNVPNLGCEEVSSIHSNIEVDWSCANE